ncbi:hypothetical protein [Pseudoalteromonas rhizosphaerae]|uniref:hypothetical protein n=1 Tax=Pseudoalteromonas rhizosphaerae TaxID=2518973 RepID=UPI002148C284|nr:hypothetical protein [Pseudoalteromonas rhizosphaerae]
MSWLLIVSIIKRFESIALSHCYQQCKNDPLQQLKSDPVNLTLVRILMTLITDSHQL